MSRPDDATYPFLQVLTKHSSVICSERVEYLQWLEYT